MRDYRLRYTSCGYLSGFFPIYNFLWDYTQDANQQTKYLELKISRQKVERQSLKLLLPHFERPILELDQLNGVRRGAADGGAALGQRGVQHQLAGRVPVSGTSQVLTPSKNIYSQAENIGDYQTIANIPSNKFSSLRFSLEFIC